MSSVTILTFTQQMRLPQHRLIAPHDSLFKFPLYIHRYPAYSDDPVPRCPTDMPRIPFCIYFSLPSLLRSYPLNPYFTLSCYHPYLSCSFLLISSLRYYPLWLLCLSFCPLVLMTPPPLPPHVPQECWVCSQEFS